MIPIEDIVVGGEYAFSLKEIPFHPPERGA